MAGRSRFWIVAACILEILYGLAFTSMSVAGSYLWRQNSCTWTSGVTGASSSSLQSTWQSAQPLTLTLPLDRQTPAQFYKHIPDEGTWLAILYTLTGFCGIIAGQEEDRIFPLLHTILALICIIWTPLMWETVYLLVRPSSNFAYSFLNEMDLITSQRHWAAYIISICVVVAGSGLYLLSAALSAYQYGVRMINLKSKLKKSQEGHSRPTVTTSAVSRVKAISTENHPRQDPLHEELASGGTPAPPSLSQPVAPTTGRSMKTLQTRLQANNETTTKTEAATTTRNGSVNVDMDETTSIPLHHLAHSSSSLSYQHHQKIRPNNIHSSAYHSSGQFFHQPDDNSQFISPRNRHRNRLDLENESLGGDGKGLAFSPYYDDAQEAIV